MTQDTRAMVGEISCLNCGRVLAQAVQDVAGGELELRPPEHQSAVRVVAAGGRVLRCGYCQGRAFIDGLAKPAERRGPLRHWNGLGERRSPSQEPGRASTSADPIK